MNFRWIQCCNVFVLVMALGIAGCVPQPAQPAAPAAAQSEAAPAEAASAEATGAEAASAGNLTDQCVQVYSPDVDYFPQKAHLEYASGFQVEYQRNYKVVTVTQAGQKSLRYVLVQCGTPTPPGFDEKEIYTVPVKSLLVMSTTYLPFLEQAGALDKIIGIDDAAFVSNPIVRQRVEEGKIAIVGAGSGVNVEKALDLQPDLVLAYNSGVPDYDAFPKLVKANLKVALAAEHAEPSPLGRAEWGKFIALFLNKEAVLEQEFAGRAETYQRLRALAAKVENKPSVFLNAEYQGTWYMAGGQSYMARLLADAGADYLWADDSSSATIMMSFEQVLERAADAQYWILSDYTSSAKALLQEDERYGRFSAFQNGRIYNNNARLSSSGGNDFFEGGTANPDVILADLIKIFHPDLLPQHSLYYYRQVESFTQ